MWQTNGILRTIHCLEMRASKLCVLPTSLCQILQPSCYSWHTGGPTFVFALSSPNLPGFSSRCVCGRLSRDSIWSKHWRIRATLGHHSWKGRIWWQISPWRKWRAKQLRHWRRSMQRWLQNGTGGDNRKVFRSRNTTSIFQGRSSRGRSTSLKPQCIRWSLWTPFSVAGWWLLLFQRNDARCP